jgi:MFS family permease
MKAITRTIFILSLVSLFNDIASEMLIPITPIYLKTIGFSIFLIGILEGVVSATSSLSNGYFGKLSDNSGKRIVFVRAGYALSAIAKPVMAFLVQPVWIFMSRIGDRLGKGMRTGARDAILSDESAHSDKGKVFGFNRAFDTLGATIGPAIALLFLYYNSGQYRSLFYYSFFPGIVVVLLTFLVKDKRTGPKPESKRVRFFDQFKYWNEAPKAYRLLAIGLLFFALFNSADAFIILKMKQQGASDTSVILIYVFYNLVYALTSFPAGIIGDKIGLKPMLLMGLFIFGVVYFGMAFAESKIAFGILLLFYGIYYACTEGIAKAWITQICENKNTATAIGVFVSLQSVSTLIASSLAGFIWIKFGSIFAFIVPAIAAFMVFFYLLLNKGVPSYQKKKAE